MIEFPYGRQPLRLPEGIGAQVIRSPAPPPGASLEETLETALQSPIGSRRLDELVSPHSRVAVVVSGAWCDEPHLALYRAVRQALAAVPDSQITLAVANSIHGPGPLPALGLPPEILSRHTVVNHDAHDQSAMIEVGRTLRGTRVRVHRCLTEADLIVTTGRVKPHSSAGYGGGAQRIFPGMGFEEDIRQNRKLGVDPAARLGRVEGNPCRSDIEEAARHVGREAFMLNVTKVGGAVLGAVAGNLVFAHRAAVHALRPYCEVRASKAEIVVVSGPLPLSANLDQASELIPPAGLLLRDGGVVILAAECPQGVGPLQLVNRAAFEAGARRYLPARYRLLLVSSLDPATVHRTFATHSPSIEAALAEARRSAGESAGVVVLPDAGDLVPIPAD